MKGDIIRAARALLGWTQEELADKAGITKQTVISVESGQQNPGARTVRRLERAIRTGGVILREDGVRYAADGVIWFRGEEAYLELLDDVLTVRPAEAVFLGADDRKSSAAVDARVDELAKAGVRMRFLVGDDCDVIKGPPDIYRRIDREQIALRDVTVIYGDRVGFYIPDPKGAKVMLILNDFLASDYKKQFQYWWLHGEEIIQGGDQ